MKRFDLGFRLFVGALAGGMVAIAIYLSFRGVLYAYGGGNHPLVDSLTMAVGPAAFVLLVGGLVLMYDA